MQALSTLSRSSHKRFAGLYLGPWNLLWERPMPLDTSLYPLLRDLFFYWQLSCSESQPPSENDKLYKCKSQLLYLRLIYFTRVSSLKKYPRRRFLSDLQIYPLLGHNKILLMDFILAVIYSSAKLWNCLSGNLRSRAQFHEFKTMILSFDKFNICQRNQVNYLKCRSIMSKI